MNIYNRLTTLIIEKNLYSLLEQPTRDPGAPRPSPKPDPRGYSTKRKPGESAAQHAIRLGSHEVEARTGLEHSKRTLLSSHPFRTHYEKVLRVLEPAAQAARGAAGTERRATTARTTERG